MTLAPSPRARRAAGVSAAWPSRLDLAVLAVLALLGLVQLAFPFTGDQALFTVGGRELLDGRVFYRDFWDVKQPGIYLFYMAAGALFGFDEVGIHLFELAWNLAFAAILQAALRSRLRSRLAASLSPLLIVGMYYAAEDVLDMTQLEMLVGLPLFVAMWGCLPSRPGRYLPLFVAGLATAVVGAFKLAYLPIACAFWLFPAWDAVRGSRPMRDLASVAGMLLLGLAVPASVALSYFLHFDLLGEVGWTWFVYPVTTTAIEGRPWSRLLEIPPHALDLLGVSAVLAVAGLVVGSAGARRRGVDRARLACLLWLGLAIALFSIQHWWTYHVPLFLPPLGLLAVLSLDDALVDGLPAKRLSVWIAAGFLAFFAVFPLKILAVKVAHSALCGFGVTREGRHSLQDWMEPYYVSGRRWAETLAAPDAVPGPVYVIGSPIALYLSGRDQAIALDGWAVDQFDRAMFRRMATQLEAARPPYLALRDVAAVHVRERSPEMVDLLARLYCPSGGSDEDAWYRLKGPGACPDAPARSR